jgi:hypothetical protein
MRRSALAGRLCLDATAPARSGPHALDHLSERERRIIDLRYGLVDGQPAHAGGSRSRAGDDPRARPADRGRSPASPARTRRRSPPARLPGVAGDSRRPGTTRLRPGNVLFQMVTGTSGAPAFAHDINPPDRMTLPHKRTAETPGAQRAPKNEPWMDAWQRQCVGRDAIWNLPLRCV